MSEPVSVEEALRRLCRAAEEGDIWMYAANDLRAAIAREKAEAVAGAYREAARIFRRLANERGHRSSLTVTLAERECESRAAAALKEKP